MSKRKPTPKRQWQPMERAMAVTGIAPGGDVWMNDRYMVITNDTPGGGMWLSIRRNDRKPIRDWRDLQQIKNDIAGDESEAFELFPAESRLVDTANQYHLWVMPPGVRMPVGWDNRLVTNSAGQTVFNGRVLTDDEIAEAATALGVEPGQVAKAVQRPREEGT